MNRFWYVICGLLLFFLPDCLENQEKIEIQSDGSGTFVSMFTLDGKADLQQLFTGGQDGTKSKWSKPIDTTFLIQEIVNPESSTGNGQKKIIEKGRYRIIINREKNEYNTTITIPFSTPDELQSIQRNNQIATIAEEKFKLLLLHEIAGAANNGPDKLPGINDINSLYDITIKKGFISRKINNERYNDMKKDPSYVQLQQMAASGLQIINTIVIKLPVPVKRIDNSFMQVSDDGQTIGIRYNLLDLFSKPGQFDYTIEF